MNSKDRQNQNAHMGESLALRGEDRLGLWGGTEGRGFIHSCKCLPENCWGPFCLEYERQRVFSEHFPNAVPTAKSQHNFLHLVF